MDSDKNHKAKESKPRLRWSYELHHRFIDAVNQLGGPNKATPKGLMRIMEIPELTLYHLKSHLQKYRHGISERSVGNKQDAKPQECQSQLDIIVTEEKDDRPNKNLHIKESIEIQLDVQKKLYKQIEVQRQLQVRIEAQSKYLRSVLTKAQETLSSYTPSNLYGVASMENISCLSSSYSEITQQDGGGEIEEEGFLGSKTPENREIRHSRRSVDSIRELRSKKIYRFYEHQEEIEVDGNQTRGTDGAQEDKVERCCVRGTTYCQDGEEDLGLSLKSFMDMETCSKSNK